MSTCLHRKLPKPRRRRLGEIRICPDCLTTLACLIWGHLAPHPRWLRWDVNDRITREREAAEKRRRVSR